MVMLEIMAMIKWIMHIGTPIQKLRSSWKMKLMDYLWSWSTCLKKLRIGLRIKKLCLENMRIKDNIIMLKFIKILWSTRTFTNTLCSGKKNFLIQKKIVKNFIFQFRYQSPDRLSRVVNKLYQWELDFHDHEHNEVLKCWRLHLGSCDVLKDVIEAQNYDSNSFRNSFINKVKI